MTHDDSRHDDERPVHGTGADAPLDEKERKTAERIAGPAGAASGAVATGLAGTVILGPLGTAIGAIAGAIGGWWAGSSAADAIPAPEDESHYRKHYGTAGSADFTYDRMRVPYHLGHVAAHNPDYAGREFDAVEADLRHGWTDDLRRDYGEWERVRPLVREGYMRRTTLGTVNPRDDSAMDLGGTPSHHRASYSDPA